MNPESLLHTGAQQLRAEATKGPGTMFVMHLEKTFSVTRTPNPASVKNIIAKYDCTEFEKGLTSTQWSTLMKRIWAAYLTDQKGGASGT